MAGERQSSEHPFQGFRVYLCSVGALKVLSQGLGASANADLSWAFKAGLRRAHEPRYSLGEGSSRKQSLGLSALESSLLVKQVGRAVTTPSFLTSSPQTVLRIVVLDLGLH